MSVQDNLKHEREEPQAEHEVFSEVQVNEAMTADDVKRLLGLSPHPCEGGWYVRTWESPELIPASCFTGAQYPDARYDGARRT